MKPPSPKADALREMRERQVTEQERVQREARRAINDINATRAELEKAVRAVAAKPKKRKGTWLHGVNRDAGFIVGNDVTSSWLKQNDPVIKRAAKPKRHK